MKIERFEDIKAWKKAKELTNLIYCYTQKSNFAKDFGLCNQIQRACVSIMSNIAEGFEGQSNQEFIRFLFMAKRSSGEARCQLYVALDQNYITKEDFKKAYDLSVEISKMISNFITYLKMGK